MDDGYEQVRTRRGRAFIRRPVQSALEKADAIVFDCDGVLIDARNSYDATTAATLDKLFVWIFGVRLPWKTRVRPLIHVLRRTGGFNNDWDTTYALSLFGACSLPLRNRRRTRGEARRFAGKGRRLNNRDTSMVFSKIGLFLGRFAGIKDQLGHASVDHYVEASMSDRDKATCDYVRDFVGYPGSPPSSLLASLFDERYCGPALYMRMYGVKPRYYSKTGFIEQDRLLVGKAELEQMANSFNGKLALLTGRPRSAAEYSLGGMMSYFQLKASVFIGDADLPIPGAEEIGAFRKPSGLGLLHAQDALHARNLLYVGDSAEDSRTAQNARKAGASVSFVAVYGTSYDTEDQVEFFKREGAELIIPSASDIPALLNRVVIN